MNRVGERLGVLLDDFHDLLLLQVLESILLQGENDLRSASKGRVDGIGSDSESSTTSRPPDILPLVVVLGDDLDAFGNKVG